MSRVFVLFPEAVPHVHVSVGTPTLNKGLRYERQNRIPFCTTIFLQKYGRLSQDKKQDNTGAGFPPSAKALGFHPEKTMNKEEATQIDRCHEDLIGLFQVWGQKTDPILDLADVATAMFVATARMLTLNKISKLKAMKAFGDTFDAVLEEEEKNGRV